MSFQRVYEIWLLQEKRDAGRCSFCQMPIVWGHCAPHGTAVPLVATPLRISREERNSAGVLFDVVASDQKHQCPYRGARRRAEHADMKKGQHVFAAFTPERIEQLKQQIDAQKPAPVPQPRRLW